MKNLKNQKLWAALIVMISIMWSCEVTEENNPPNAVATSEVRVELGTTTTLDGSASSDVDGDDLTYEWSLVDAPGPNLDNLSNSNSAVAQFQPIAAGNFTFQLTVSDPAGASDTDEVTIEVFAPANESPSAVILDENGDEFSNANDNFTFNVGSELILNGEASSDPDGDAITYEWAVENAPTGSAVTFSAPESVNTTMVVDLPGEYSISLTVRDGEGGENKAQITLEAEVAPVIIDASIEENTTLENIYDDPSLPDYRVVANINVIADLIIEPGVVIEFENNIGMSVQGEGSVNAVGTDSENIVFTGVQKVSGFWKGINIQSNSVDNVFNHTIVEYGGSEGFDGADLLANIMVHQAARVEIENSILRNSAGSGLYLRNDQVEVPTFNNNTLTDNNYPASSLLTKFHLLGSNSSYSGNTNDYINGVDDNLEQAVTWQSLDVPYRLPGTIIGILSELTIEAGARFIGASQAGLQVYQEGALIAIGTEQDNISFYGEEDVRGFWRGISIETNNTSNELTHVNVSNGGESGFDGADVKGNVIMDDFGRLKINNTTLTKSGGAGIALRSEDNVISEFNNNVISDNETAVNCILNHFGFFDEASDLTGNDNDYVSAFTSGGVSNNQTWNKLSVPYRLLPNYFSQISGNITIAPGAEIVGRENSGLIVVSGASLSAVGTTDERIIFRGQENVTGYWRGLRFLSNTTSNILEFVNVSNGGSDGFDGADRKANVEVGGSNARCQFVECNINDSGGYGIRIQSGGTYTISSTNFSGNQQTGNAEGGGVQNDNL